MNLSLPSGFSQDSALTGASGMSGDSRLQMVIELLLGRPRGFHGNLTVAQIPLLPLETRGAEDTSHPVAYFGSSSRCHASISGVTGDIQKKWERNGELVRDPTDLTQIWRSESEFGQLAFTSESVGLDKVSLAFAQHEGHVYIANLNSSDKGKWKFFSQGGRNHLRNGIDLPYYDAGGDQNYYRFPAGRELLLVTTTCGGEELAFIAVSIFGRATTGGGGIEDSDLVAMSVADLPPQGGNFCPTRRHGANRLVGKYPELDIFAPGGGVSARIPPTREFTRSPTRTSTKVARVGSPSKPISQPNPGTQSSEFAWGSTMAVMAGNEDAGDAKPAANPPPPLGWIQFNYNSALWGNVNPIGADPYKKIGTVEAIGVLLNAEGEEGSFEQYEHGDPVLLQWNDAQGCMSNVWDDEDLIGHIDDGNHVRFLSNAALAADHAMLLEGCVVRGVLDGRLLIDVNVAIPAAMPPGPVLGALGNWNSFRPLDNWSYDAGTVAVDHGEWKAGEAAIPELSQLTITQTQPDVPPAAPSSGVPSDGTDYVTQFRKFDVDLPPIPRGPSQIENLDEVTTPFRAIAVDSLSDAAEKHLRYHPGKSLRQLEVEWERAERESDEEDGNESDHGAISTWDRFIGGIHGLDPSNGPFNKKEWGFNCALCNKFRFLPASIGPDSLPSVCSQNIWDRERNNCDAPQEEGRNDEVTSPPNTAAVTDYPSVATELCCSLWVFSGDRDRPSKEIFTPDFNVSGIGHVRPLMMVYDDGSGCSLLLYPVFHRKSWEDHERLPFPASVEDSEYRDAFGNRAFPYYHGDPTGANNLKNTARYYKDGKLNIKWHPRVKTRRTGDEVMRRLDSIEGKSKMTKEALQQRIYEEGVVEFCNTKAFVRCGGIMVSSSHAGMMITHDERVKLGRFHDDTLFQKICDKHREAGKPTYDPERYDMESSELVNLFNTFKLDDPAMCGDTFQGAFPPGRSAKSTGAHCTPNMAHDLVLSTFQLGYVKVKLGDEWWRDRTGDEKRWLEAMDGRLCIMPPFMFHPSFAPTFLKLEKINHEHGYAILTGGSAMNFSRYHGDRVHSHRLKYPEGATQFLIFFRPQDLQLWTRQCNADLLIGCEQIGKFYMPMPVWLGFMIHFNNHYTSNYSTLTQIIDNFNFCAPKITDLNTRNAVLGKDLAEFEFACGKVFDPQKNKGGLVAKVKQTKKELFRKKRYGTGNS